MTKSNKRIDGSLQEQLVKWNKLITIFTGILAVATIVLGGLNYKLSHQVLVPTPRLLLNAYESVSILCGNNAVAFGPILTIYNVGNAVAVDSKLVIKYGRPNFYFNSSIINSYRPYPYNITTRFIPRWDLNKARQYGEYAPKYVNNTGTLYGYPLSEFEYHLDLGDLIPGELLNIMTYFGVSTYTDCGKKQIVSFQVVEEAFKASSEIKNVTIEVIKR